MRARIDTGRNEEHQERQGRTEGGGGDEISIKVGDAAGRLERISTAIHQGKKNALLLEDYRGSEVDHQKNILIFLPKRNTRDNLTI